MKNSVNDFHKRLERQFSSANSDPPGWGRNVNLSYCEFMQKNKPQSNSIAGGLLVLGAGGYHIAWLLWKLPEWRDYIATFNFFLHFFCWYFGNIIGSIVGAAIVTTWEKKKIYYLCGTTSTIGAILFIACYHINELIMVGRFIAGVSHGIAYLTTITHGAENVIKELRGRLISSIHFIIYSSIFTVCVVMLYSYPAPGGIRIEQMIGILVICFTLMGVAFTPCLTYESVTFLLHRNNERQALENMIKLRNETFVTWSISNDLQELKLMVAEDKVKSKNIVKDSNKRPLLLMLALSVISVLSSNLILNTHLIEITAKSFLSTFYGTYPGIASTAVASVILVTFRYCSGLVMIFSGDLFSRKKCLRLSAAIAALSLLATHILSSFNLENASGINWIPGVLTIVFQISVGAGVEPMLHVLMSEAFSTAKKYWSIALVVTLHSLMQMAIVAGLHSINESIIASIFIYLSVVLIALLTLVLHFKLPETRGISLRQARDEFTKTGIIEGITYS
ncbi:putative metabolite transport protein CsbC [Pseudolycoriella hygida]|uniref:Metabolite transport protein CsbC n=1 Tax=Pseudolycoriella hygida TaxID=35572 RepID=A0A9Q0RVR7_9DIPT|nr:putative metabolite transport protein CsbC [Pseudolycoriella hygida]